MNRPCAVPMNERDVRMSEAGPAELASITGGAWFLMPAAQGNGAANALTLNFHPALATPRAIEGES
jgi:hypothetical protein